MIPIMLLRLRIRRRLYSKMAPDCGKIFCKIAGEKTLIDLYGKWCAQIQQIKISFPDFLSWCLQIWRNTNSTTGNIIIIASSLTQTCTLFVVVTQITFSKVCLPLVQSSKLLSRHQYLTSRSGLRLINVTDVEISFRIVWVRNCRNIQLYCLSPIS